jgi:hypothetical protein
MCAVACFDERTVMDLQGGRWSRLGLANMPKCVTKVAAFRLAEVSRYKRELGRVAEGRQVAFLNLTTEMTLFGPQFGSVLRRHGEVKDGCA